MEDPWEAVSRQWAHVAVGVGGGGGVVIVIVVVVTKNRHVFRTH